MCQWKVFILWGDSDGHRHTLVAVRDGTGVRSATGYLLHWIACAVYCRLSDATTGCEDYRQNRACLLHPSLGDADAGYPLG